MNAFANSAMSRETSDEIIEAIEFISGGNNAESERIWEEPTEAEALAIWERVTKNGLIKSSEFCWGAAGGQWAQLLGVEHHA